MVEQLFTAKRRRIEAEIVTTNRSREFLPVPHSPKDLDSRPSTSLTVPAAPGAGRTGFRAYDKIGRCSTSCLRSLSRGTSGDAFRAVSFRGLVPGPSGDLSPVLQGSRHPEVGFAMSRRDKGERTNDCGKKRKGKKRKSGLSVIDEGQATSDTLFCSHQSRFSARSRLLQRDEDRNQTLTINQRTQRFSNNRAWRFG